MQVWDSVEYPSFKMRAMLLDRRRRHGSEEQNVNTTPSRGNVRFPRLRLLEKDVKNDHAPVHAASNYQASAANTTTAQILRGYLIPAPKQTCPTDRFIPRRRGYSFEAANYLLMKETESAAGCNRLDVFAQMDALPNAWRKRLMRNAMTKENVMPGLKQKRVLRGCRRMTDSKLAGGLSANHTDLIGVPGEEGIWKANSRKKPLIGIMDSILDMPEFTASSFCPQLLDWSVKNIAAATIRDSVAFFSTRAASDVDIESVDNIKVCALKWSSAGDRLAMCTISSTVNVYDVVTQKFLWTASCASLTMFNAPCLIRCICWSKNDKYIVTGCREALVYNASTSVLVQRICMHNGNILAMSFSANYRYLVTTADDKNVRVYAWPQGIPYLQMGYYDPVKAVAWHPEDNGLLCVGGAYPDASLSLWNVNKQDPLSYRRVKFSGCVENLSWNKQSGELVVQWSYWEERKRYTVMPILASLDRIVDVIPVNKEDRVGHVLWNSNQTQLATQANESLMIWDFFGNGYRCPQTVNKSVRDTVRSPTAGPRTFSHFTIR